MTRESLKHRGGVAAVLAVLLVSYGAAAQMSGGQANAARAAAAGAANPGTPSAARSSQSAAAPPNNTPAAAAPQASSAPAPPSSGGRRDPFRPLTPKPAVESLPERLPPGKSGLVIGQLNIQGIVRGIGGNWIAVADNKTKRAYFLYKGDELYNGTVASITEDSVVFQERYTDAAGQKKTREIVKRLTAQ